MRFGEPRDGAPLISERTARRVILAISFGGALVFGSVLGVAYANESLIERAAEAFLSDGVDRRFGAGAEIVSDALATDFGSAASPNLSVRELALPRPNRLVRRQDPDSRGAEPLSRPPRRHQTYERLLGSLIHEVRLFAGCNLVLFALAMLLAGRRRQETTYLILPAGILAAATCLAVVMYLVMQDWVWTVLTGRYLGLWYLVVVGTAAFLMADIAWNRARVNAWIARALWHSPA